MGIQELDSSRGVVAGHLSLPKTGRGPGVLVLHAWWGLNGFFQSVCDRLAASGFTTFAPDLYHGATATTVDGAEKLMSGLKHDAARRDLAASVAALRNHPGVSGPPLGVIGFSMGAYYGVELAQDHPTDIGAVVVFYGIGGGSYEKTSAAFLGHFAAADPYESDDAIRGFEKAVRAAGREITTYQYPGTMHWFFEEDRPDAYQATAANLAWQRTVQFLNRHLSGPKSL